MSMTPHELNAAIDAAYPGRDWNGMCEAFRFQSTRLSNGLGNMQSFDSAKIAKANSRLEAYRPENTPAGWVGWWDKTVYGHDMICFGSDLWMGATTLGDTIVDFGGGIKLLHGSTYPAVFLGAARVVGGNPQLQLTPYGTGLPGGVPVVGGGSSGAAWNQPSAALQSRIQKALKARGRYSGPVDGAWGPNTVKGIQTTLKGVGYNGPIDGIAGPNTCRLVQVYAQKFGSYTGPIDSVLGPNSWAGFALGLERP